MTESPKLLPCPFCGRDVYPGIEWVMCDDCKIELPIRAWNKRAPDLEREAMANVCEAASDFVGAQGRYGFEQQAYLALDKSLSDLERARKGKG